MQISVPCFSPHCLFDGCEQNTRRKYCEYKNYMHRTLFSIFNNLSTCLHPSNDVAHALKKAQNRL